ncbi:hypothetical protein B0F90DRAFT_1817816 [Multifurca ochricompacta]|uniref:Protein kinase domain-containing protein n=1 Tax=Multifurca ochricompacta TaxID=376703 RepID=A0AAD4QKG1_9AGAM|nr:hypothetical protein B0F90DRAFT_1817816 [Multifurca ochricompacta]
MSTLVLTMPPSPELPLNYEHRTLRAHDTHKTGGPSIYLKNTTWLRGQSIMRGTLSSPRGTFDVVAKLGTSTNTINSLKKELSFYHKLRHLQGVCIPKCFGYFFNPSEGQTFGCLILEYSGKPIRSTYDSQDDVPFALRVNIVSALKNIHDAGVVHGGFGIFDVLIASGKPFLINFKTASEKVCERRMDIVNGAIAPRREQFGCPELHRVCVDFRIWKPRTFNFDGQRFPVEDVSSPAALAEKISGDSGLIDKSRTEAVHATVRHLLDFYREEFPGLEDWHKRWLAAGSPLPAQTTAEEGGNDVASDLWNLQIPIRSPMAVHALT